MSEQLNDKEEKTQRLYYTDSYVTVFTATVRAVEQVNDQPVLVLDRTCFYPTSGGQPNDTGVLAGQRVVDVVAQEDVVLHVLAAAAGVKAGDSVQATVDWPRRYDHMQQHSGQHLLSQIFARLYAFETVSVHFGADESTLDLDAAAVTPEQIAAAERQANELAYTALSITAYFVGDDALAAIPLRRQPKVTGEIRIVEIAGVDYSACGGTHVRSTAEITPIKIVRQERRRGQTRITFKCGLRAYQDYAERHRLIGETANLFSTEVNAVPGLAQRLLEQNRDLQRQVDGLTARVITYEIAELLAAAQPANGLRVVQQLYPDRSVDALKQTATLLREQAGTVALLGTTAGGKLTLVFARSDDAAPHMGNLLRDTLKAFGGGGGGRPEIAQGGGVEASQGEAILVYARSQINES